MINSPILFFKIKSQDLHVEMFQFYLATSSINIAPFQIRDHWKKQGHG